MPLDQTIHAHTAQIKQKNRLWTRYIEVRSDNKYREYCKARIKVRKLTRSAAKFMKQISQVKVNQIL